MNAVYLKEWTFDCDQGYEMLFKHKGRNKWGISLSTYLLYTCSGTVTIGSDMNC